MEDVLGCRYHRAMIHRDDAPLMADFLPELAVEMETALKTGDRPDLASQVGSLRIVELCGCGDDFCASFYTGPKPDAGWGSGHENVIPSVEEGMLVLDVVDGVIRFVEVLHRDDVRDLIQPDGLES